MIRSSDAPGSRLGRLYGALSDVDRNAGIGLSVPAGRDERERRQLLELVAVAARDLDDDNARSDVGRLLDALLNLDAAAEETAADWLRDALHHRRSS